MAQLHRREVDRNSRPHTGILPRSSLAARLIEHPCAQLDDHAASLGYRNELRWRYQTPLGVLPADQRLEPDHPAGGELNLWLVVKHELGRIECPAEVALQLPPGASLQIHCRL